MNPTSFRYVNLPKDEEEKSILPDEQTLLNKKSSAIKNAISNQSNQSNQSKLKDNGGFLIVALLFFIGALTFAVALSYNNLASSIIEKYSFKAGILGSLINFSILVGIALFVIWLAWKKYPLIVESKII
jgi:hypothetical protein